jgi:O-antigen/teichoic acid export membrane protein
LAASVDCLANLWEKSVRVTDPDNLSGAASTTAAAETLALVDDSIHELAVSPQRSFLIYASSYLIVGATPFLLLPVLTKHLTPHQFGEVTSFLVLTALLANMAGLSAHGFLAARYFKVAPMRLAELISTSLATVATMHLLMLALVAFAFRYLENALGVSLGYALLAVLAAFVLNLNLVFLAIFQFSGRPWHYLRMRAAQGTAELGICIALLLLVSADASARIWSYTAAIAISAAGGLIHCVRNGLIVAHWDRDSANSLLRFGLPLLPHVAAGMAITYTDRLLVSSLLGAESLGLYMVATQIGMAMVALIEPLNKALAPWLFEQLAKNQEGVRRMVVRRTYQLFGTLTLCGVLIAVAANILFAQLIGEKFGDARELLPWMVGGYVAQGMYYAVVNYMFYAEKTGALAVITGTAAAVGCAVSYSLITAHGITGAGVAFFLNNVILMLLVWIGASKTVPMPWMNWRRNDLS